MRRRGKSGRKPSQSLDWIMRTRGSDNLCDLRTALGRKTGGPAGAFVGRLSEDKRARIGRKRGLKAQGINGPRASWAFRGQVMARVTCALPLDAVGADGGGRTHTLLRVPDFESSASASSATSALLMTNGSPAEAPKQKGTQSICPGATRLVPGLHRQAS